MVARLGQTNAKPKTQHLVFPHVEVDGWLK